MFLIQGKCKLTNRVIKNYKSKQSKRMRLPGVIFCMSLQTALPFISCEDTKRVISSPRASVSPGAKREAWRWKTKASHYWSEKKAWNPWEWDVSSSSGWGQNQKCEAKNWLNCCLEKDIIVLWPPKYEGHWKSSIWNITGAWNMPTETCYITLCDISWPVLSCSHSLKKLRSYDLIFYAACPTLVYSCWPFRVGWNLKDCSPDFYFVDKDIEIGYAG